MRRVVIITGGASGLGRYMTLEFARRGYTVAFTYQNSVHAALQLEESLCGMDCLSHAEQIDVASEKAVSAFVQRVLGAFGRIDTLINNTGIFENSLIADTTLESWNRVIRVDLTGSFLFIKHVFPVMKAQMEGSIVNITSVMGESGIYGACSYAAAKAGLIGLTKSVALEGARYGIRSNSVSVGLMDQGMSLTLSSEAASSLLRKIPLKRPGTAEELAGLVADLSAQKMAYLTGQVIRFNGGMYM